MFIFVLSPDSLRKFEDGQRLLSDKVRSGNSNNSWVWYYDLSIILYLGGCYNGEFAVTNAEGSSEMQSKRKLMMVFYDPYSFFDDVKRGRRIEKSLVEGE